jgi:hypothetical protein
LVRQSAGPRPNRWLYLVIDALGRVEANTAPMSPAARAAMQKRVEGLAASLARVAARDGSRPLLMALTGTPLNNDIEDFLAIWEFLGCISGAEVEPEMGVVRRRKVDVAKDIPVRAAEKKLVARLVAADYAAQLARNAIDAFLNDDDVQIIVCSLTAAEQTLDAEDVEVVRRASYGPRR